MTVRKVVMEDDHFCDTMLLGQYNQVLSIIVQVCTIESSISQDSICHRWLQLGKRAFTSIWPGQLFRKGLILNILHDSSLCFF